MVDRTRSELGRIDVLVNNAGIAGVEPALTDFGEDGNFYAVYDVTVKGTCLCTTAVAPDDDRSGQRLHRQPLLHGRVSEPRRRRLLPGEARDRRYHFRTQGHLATLARFGSEMRIDFDALRELDREKIRALRTRHRKK